MMRMFGTTLVTSVMSLLFTSSLVCSNDARQDDLPQKSENSGETDPPKSLDELLGIDGGSGDDDSLLENRDRKKLEDRLQEREIESDLESAIDDMDLAAEMISTDGNVGLDLQRLQQSIIDRLDAVIEEAKRRQEEQQSSSSSSSSSESSSEQPTSEPPSNTSGDRQEGDEGSTAAGERADGPASGQPQTMNVVQSGSEGVLFEESDVEWGRLPDRVRDVIRQGMRESISRRYKALTEAYYRRLAEEASQ